MKDNDTSEKVISINDGKKQVKKKRRTPRRVFALCLIAFAVGIFAFRDRIDVTKWLNTVDSFFGKGISSEDIKLTYDSSTSSSADFYGDFISVLTAKQLTMYNNEGKAEYRLDVQFANPVLKCYDKYTLAYDCGGTELYVTNSYKQIFHNSFEGTIVNARLSSDGHLVVVTKMKNYKAAVTVYSSSFKEVYKVYSASDYVADADVSNNGKKLVVAMYEGGYGEIVSKIRVYSLDEEEYKSEITPIEGLILSVDYKDRDRIHILTQQSYLVSEDGGTASEVLDFDNRRLEHFDICSDDKAIIVLDGRLIGKGSAICVFNSNGAETADIQINSEIKGFDKTEDYIFAATPDGLNVYNYSGDITDTIEVSPTTEKILASENGELVVFETGNVYIIK